MDESQKKWGTRSSFTPEEGSKADDEFESALRASLRSLPAPIGFSERVLARTDPTKHATGFHKQPVVVQEISRLRSRQPLSFLPSHTRSGPRLGFAAVLLLLIAMGGYFSHQRQQRIAGERARQQVLLALRITSSTLQAVRAKVDSDRTNYNKVD